jgi:NAD(P)-dependent dehydrogenase (short-subunit alcohol dehydrogenase family)
MSSDYSILRGKHALVTGGARGIGEAIAKALAANGARVSVVSRNPAGVAAQFTTAEADVTNEAQLKAAFEACRKANGPIEILVSNSGIADSAPLTRTSLELFDRIISTNLTGTFLACRDAAQDMLKAKWGRILNVASMAGLHGAPYVSAYCASKHGVIGFTRAIAAEFAGMDTNITANTICPGYTETDMMQQAIDKIIKFTGATKEMARDSLAAMNPEGRIATVDEVASASLDLICGDKNGVSLVIPGGMEA